MDCQTSYKMLQMACDGQQRRKYPEREEVR